MQLRSGTTCCYHYLQGAQWEYSGLPRLPLDMRVTDTGGQEIIIW